MKFDAGTRTRITATMTLDFDPTATTIEVKVGPTWYPATWQGTPVTSGGKWTQAARTTTYFAGAEADPAGAVVLPATRHLTQTRVTSGTDVIVADTEPIDVA